MASNLKRRAEQSPIEMPEKDRKLQEERVQGKESGGSGDVKDRGSRVEGGIGCEASGVEGEVVKEPEASGDDDFQIAYYNHMDKFYERMAAYWDKVSGDDDEGEDEVEVDDEAED